jgi:hypothetical protein
MTLRFGGSSPKSRHSTMNLDGGGRKSLHMKKPACALSLANYNDAAETIAKWLNDAP